MYPAVIEEYLRPRSLAEAVAALGKFASGEAIFLAGGQSVMQAIKSRMVRPRCVVDLQAITELKGITTTPMLRIGAMTRYVELAEDRTIGPAYAALRDAAQHVGDRQVRNRGTIGGSCCWNYLASCLPAVTLGLEGSMHLLSSAGITREVKADDFLIAPLETARAEDEILTAISFPNATRTGSAYKKWGLVTDALPVVGVCMKVTIDAAGQCTAARIALSGLAAGAQRAPAGERLLAGSVGDLAAIERALEAVVGSVTAQSDQWADTAYRQQLIRTLGREVAASAFARARG
jgi:aerobic carbon-monoxide dehydrogenase medium subunit